MSLDASPGNQLAQMRISFQRFLGYADHHQERGNQQWQFRKLESRKIRKSPI
jgi:hypothetical protein